MKHNAIKKVLSLLLVICMMASFTGCIPGDEDPTQPSTIETTGPTESTTAPTGATDPSTSPTEETQAPTTPTEDMTEPPATEAPNTDPTFATELPTESPVETFVDVVETVYAVWSLVQQMEKYPLTVEELKEYAFYDKGWHRNYRIKEITDAYIIHTEDEHFFLVMQTKNGDTLLGYGWEDLGERGQGASDDTCLEYLYKLEFEFSNYEFNTNFFSLSLRNSVGDTDCFHSYRNDKNPGFVVVGFMADPDEKAAHGYNDMGYAVFQANDTGYRLLNYQVYDNAANENNGILFCSDPAILSLDDEHTNAVTYDVILSCNENLDKIQREYYKDDELVLQTADTAIGGHKNMSLFCWDEMDGPNLRVKQYYLDSEGNEIDFDVFGEAVDDDYLRALIVDIVENPESFVRRCGKKASCVKI